MTKGRNFGDRLLSITWHASVPRPGRNAHPHLLSTVHLNSHRRQVMMVGESGELIDGVEGEDAEDAEEVGDLVWLCHLFKFSIHHILF